MKKLFFTVVASVLGFVLVFSMACNKKPTVVPDPESIAITNVETTLVPGVYILTACIEPADAYQEYKFTLLGDVSGVTIEGDKLTVSENTEDGEEITVKVTASYDQLISAKKTFTVSNEVIIEYIEISSEAELRAALIDNGTRDYNKNYRLTNDIVLTQEWEGVGRAADSAISDEGEGYNGRFNGNGFTISGMSVTTGTGYNQAFFNQTDEFAIVENLSLKGTVKGRNWNSALVGINNGIVRNCVTDVKVENASAPASGMVGTNNGKIINSYAIGEVIVGESSAGHGAGFVNANNGEIISSFGLQDAMPNAVGYKCTSDKTVTKTELQIKTASTYSEWDEEVWFIADGMFPQLRNPGFVEPSIEMQVYIEEFNFMDYTAGQREHKLEWEVYNAVNKAVTITYAEPVSGETDIPGVDVSSEGLITLSDAVLDNTHVTITVAMTAHPEICDSVTVKILNKGAQPRFINIDSADKLISLTDMSAASAMSANFRLTKDISLLDKNFVRPIAAEGEFSGIFDGQGHIISGFACTTETSQHGGLFNKIGEKGKVYALGLETVDAGIKAGSSAALLASVNNGIIENCYVKGKIVTSKNYAAGLVFSNYGEIKDCWVDVIVGIKMQEDGSFTTVGDASVVWDNYQTGEITGVFVNTDHDSDSVKAVMNDKNSAVTDIGRLNEEAMKSAATYVEWDKNVWFAEDGKYPVLIKNGQTEEMEQNAAR